MRTTYVAEGHVYHACGNRKRWSMKCKQKVTSSETYVFAYNKNCTILERHKWMEFYK